MTKITFVDADGTATQATADHGMSLMQVAVSAGIAAISAECGGACACGTCHCYVAQEWAEKLAPPQADETDMLEFVIDPAPTSRLSCQIEVTPELDGLVITLPPSQT